LGLVVLAVVGAVLLVVVATSAWPKPADERAYWLAAERLAAGQPLYDPNAAPNTPYAYWYPPPLAQVLVPLTRVLDADAFSALWTAMLLGCLWFLSGRRFLVALALVAYVPVAVELQSRNAHLVLAVLIVLALRRSTLFWVPAAALKIGPVLGILYLVAAGRLRQAVAVAIAGAIVLAASIAISPGAWLDFAGIAGARGGDEGGGLLRIPYVVRFLVGALLVAAGGRITALDARQALDLGKGTQAAESVGSSAMASEHRTTAVRRLPVPLGELLLVVGLTIANPTLWLTAFSLLSALVPLARSPRLPQVPLHLESAGSKQSG
jgi:hypothetical protein